MKRVILYARVSRGEDQDPESQLQALRKWAQERSWRVVGEFSDRLSGDPKRRKTSPPELAAAMQLLRAEKADMLAVWALDRVIRSGRQILNFIYDVEIAGGTLVSYQNPGLEALAGPIREFLVAAYGFVAAIEIDLIRSRTRAGLARARKEGRRLGRPPLQVPELGEVVELWRTGHSIRESARILNVPKFRIEVARREIEREGCAHE